MVRNVGRLDQFIRIFIGLALIAYVFRDGTLMPGGLVLGLIGAVLLGTAFFGYCPAYALLGVSSKGQAGGILK